MPSVSTFAGLSSVAISERQILVSVKAMLIMTIFSIFMFIQFCIILGIFSVPGSSPTYQPGKSDTHYAVVLDAGSSGTRAYLYSWPDHSGDKHELLKISPLLEDGEPMVKKATPGLSSLGGTPDNAFEYIRPLPMFASENIPKEKHKEAPCTSSQRLA